MDNLLRVGLIVKPQGIRGEVKVISLTDDSSRFKFLNEVIIDGILYKVLNARVLDNEVFVALKGVADRNTAELLRGKYMSVDRQNAVELEEGRYFITDIEGCLILDEQDNLLGTITEITEANTDIFTVKCINGKIMRFPFLKKVVFKVDTENKKVYVYRDKLEEVSVYED